MGTLYGIAGLAHAADCLRARRRCLTAAGAPPFEDLPPPAQALAGMWCLAGPVAYAASRRGGRRGRGPRRVRTSGARCRARLHRRRGAAAAQRPRRAGASSPLLGFMRSMQRDEIDTELFQRRGRVVGVSA